MRIAFAGIALLAVLSMEPALAAPPCPEGKTFSGECINPSLGAIGRDRGINIVARKLGGPSSARNMPSNDTLYRDPAWQSYLRNSHHFYQDLYIYGR
jgi:hypothetical protein